MIQMETVLRSADNSGARFVKCIKVLGGLKRRVGHAGDRLLVSIKYLRNNKKLNKREVYSAILVGTKKPTRRVDASVVRFDRSRAIILNDQLKFVGTRVYGTVLKEVKLLEYGDFSNLIKSVI